MREKWADFMNDFGQCEQRGEGVNANFHVVNGIMGMIYVYEIIIKLYISYKFKVIWVVRRIIDMCKIDPIYRLSRLLLEGVGMQSLVPSIACCMQN